MKPHIKELHQPEIITVFGMGKVGLPLSVFYASRRFLLYGVDTNKDRISQLQNGNNILYEDSFDDLFNKYRKNIIFTTDYDLAITSTSVIFIIVPTPSQKNGSFSLKYVLDVVKKIATVLKKQNGWKLINIISTIMPESMDKIIKPEFEKISRKKAGINFGLCYSPEFVALGLVIKNLQSPDFILIGQSDKKSGQMLAKIKKSVCLNNPPIHFSNFINAELAKIASNTFITTKISFANMLTGICQKSPGADIDRITNILGDDSSIGGKRLSGSVGYGGPCYPRDNIALGAYAKTIGANANIAINTHKFNIKQVDYLTELILNHSDPDAKIGILGLSYKPDTDVVEESIGIKLAQNLVEKVKTVNVYDPLAMNNAKIILDNSVKYFDSVSEVLQNSDTVVITTPWDHFKKINDSPSRTITVIDCWRILDEKYRSNFNYIPLGIGPMIK